MHGARWPAIVRRQYRKGRIHCLSYSISYALWQGRTIVPERALKVKATSPITLLRTTRRSTKLDEVRLSVLFQIGPVPRNRFQLKGGQYVSRCFSTHPNTRHACSAGKRERDQHSHQCGPSPRCAGSSRHGDSYRTNSRCPNKQQSTRSARFCSHGSANRPRHARSPADPGAATAAARPGQGPAAIGHRSSKHHSVQPVGALLAYANDPAVLQQFVHVCKSQRSKYFSKALSESRGHTKTSSRRSCRQIKLSR
jgi:hypothetical protein